MPTIRPNKDQRSSAWSDQFVSIASRDLVQNHKRGETNMGFSYTEDGVKPMRVVISVDGEPQLEEASIPRNEVYC